MAPTALLVAHTTKAGERLTRKLEQTGIFGGIIPFHCSQEALRHLDQYRADVVFCTVERGERESLSLLETLSRRPDGQDLPLVAVTRESDREGRISSLEHGAVDCVTFETHAEELAARILAVLRRQARIVELRQATEKLSQLARTDALTGLGNRNCFDRSLEQEVARTERSRSPFSLMMVDIDFFKRINDAHGHQTGDAVLQAVAEVLQTSARVSDVVCRYGGEEFALILPGTTAPKAVILANRIHRNLAELSRRLPEIGQPISVSIGIKCANGKTNLPARQIVEAADQALYAAKRNGRNRTEIALSSTPVLPLDPHGRRYANA